MPRFTLRTLFVVVTLIAVALGWLMWQRSIVQQREALLDTIGLHRGGYAVVEEKNGHPIGLIWAGSVHLSDEFDAQRVETLGPGAIRRWLGDRPIGVVWPKGMPVDITERVRTLIPEAIIQDPLPATPQVGQHLMPLP